MKRIISMLLMLSLMTVSWALAEKQQDMENKKKVNTNS